ncbi:MAG: hypothetical protein K8F25_13805 [Fimbriimonadaceae bacterium]|nr:hypothetical protein [Alphaproteobacteria bacterium]
MVTVKIADRNRRGTSQRETGILSENESIFTPADCIHRLGNPGDVLLEVIEIKTVRIREKMILFASKMNLAAADISAGLSNQAKSARVERPESGIDRHLLKKFAADFPCRFG